MADRMSVENKDPKEETEESMGSSPGEEPGQAGNTTQENQQPKRKGGRKPIYATSEERKQRNRQAQAAFRERRTEYIKQLEETIRVHEQNLHSLQAAHRHAADECLMLRYKNSLLERILLEKGIDVQAELRAKTGSPNLGPTHVPQNLVQPPPMPRTILNRHHNRRSNSSIAPKLEPGVTSLPAPIHAAHGNSSLSVASPKNRPTPPSHAASPTTTSGFGASPAASDHIAPSSMRPVMPPTAMKPQPPPNQMSPMSAPPQAGMPRMMQQMQGGMPQHHAAAQHHAMRMGGASVTASPYYPSPSFQNHMEQLEQEYDAAADMMDDTADPPDTPSGQAPYPGAPYGAEQPQSMNLSSPATTGPTDGSVHGGQSQQGGYPSMTQLLDPSLDWDPFGLSASMAFPTQFSFDTSNMR